LTSTATTLESVREEAKSCRGCSLWERATQTVFGEGPVEARALLVGEQPGDREDREGRPFVGPAGKLLDTALEEAGLHRDDVYLTNAVKHFKWKPTGGGKRRLHDKPSWVEVGACLPWLHSELTLLRPEVVVCLGATAAQALLGRSARVGELRGRVLTDRLDAGVVVTAHPSAVLRAPDGEARAEARAALVSDLAVAARLLGETRPHAEPSRISS
jgi:DNA polymerase